MNKGCLIAVVAFVLVVLLAAGGVLYFLYEKENSDPVSYKTETPAIRDIVLKSVATGSVEPRREIEIKPQISGIIRELFVEAGDTVREGDMIARVKVIPDMVSMNNAENRVSRARISADNAQMDYDRNKSLLDKGVIAVAEFQQFEIARRNASEELTAAEDNLQIIKEGVAKSSGKATNTVVKSTIQGMVLDVPVEEGNSVIEANNFNDGTTIAAVADMKDLIFKGFVDESEVEKLDRGMELIVTIGAVEGRKYNAVLEYISPKGMLNDGAIQFEVKAAMKMDKGEFIRAGYSANADVVLDKKDQVLSISESVVQYDGNSPFVEMGEGDDWVRKDVKLGLSDGIYVEVIEGVSESDNIKLWNQPIKN